MLRHNDVWRAERCDAFARGASCVASWHRRHDVVRWAKERAARRLEGIVLCVRRPSDKTVNPVRWCARRRLVGVAVAWAAPLFSDHAPKEVHLWQ